MTQPLPSHKIRCRSCQESWILDPIDLVEQLRSLGMLKRQKDPEPQMILELFSGARNKLTCRACDSGELDIEAHTDEWDDEWDIGRKCEDCGTIIPPERLEIFPDSRTCTSCQRKAEQGIDDSEPEYCPHCGSIMVVKRTGGSGISRYVMSCPDCRR